MRLPDVNILLYAHRPEYDRHAEFRSWLLDLAEGDEPYGMSEVVLSGFVRVVTNRKVHPEPSSLPEALDFAGRLIERPNCVRVTPGPNHWVVFERMCRAINAQGNHVSDAFYAALAIESGSEWITADRGFARFPGLRWCHPLDG